MSISRESIDDNLHDPGAPRPLLDDLRRLWDRKSYVVYSSYSDLRSRQMDTVLGSLWHLLNPILQIAVYFVIFGLILGTDRGVDNFLPFLAIGVFAYQFMRSAISSGAKSVVNNQGLVQSFDFPRGLLPTSATGAEVAAFLPPLLVMGVVAVITGEPITLKWLLVIPIFALQTGFTLGMAFIAARITFHFRDFENILTFLFRMFFYFSGVLFLIDRYVSDPVARQIADLNPLYDYISLYRWAIMDMPVTDLLVGSALAWALIGLPLGYLWFRARESEYGM